MANFCKKFVFAVESPNEQQLQLRIINEFEKDFTTIGNPNLPLSLAHQISNNLVEWFENKNHKWLTQEEAIDTIRTQCSNCIEPVLVLTTLQMTNSDLSMELQLEKATKQFDKEKQRIEVTKLREKLAETVCKLSKQEESIERDQRQQTASRMADIPLRCEKAGNESPKKVEGDIPALRK